MVGVPEEGEGEGEGEGVTNFRVTRRRVLGLAWRDRETKQK